MFKRLLVPLDGSALAEQAIGQAIAIARAAKAEIDLVLVHQPFPFEDVGDTSRLDALLNEEHRYIESIVAEITSGSPVPVTHVIMKGAATEMICRRIEDVQADLVVMTSHGRTGLSRAWLGSVADSVVRRSTAPVLMLRPIEGKTRRDAAHHLFKRVLMPVDGSAFSMEVFPSATALAKCSGASLSLLRVVEPFPLVSPDAGIPYAYMPAVVNDPEMKNFAKKVEGQLRELASALSEESGMNVDAHVVVEPRVASAIHEFARTHDADVIAMTTHGRGMSRLLAGSVADKVLRGGSLPMLLFRPLEARDRA